MELLEQGTYSGFTQNALTYEEMNSLFEDGRETA
jgi:hypothetical protein